MQVEGRAAVCLPRRAAAAGIQGEMDLHSSRGMPLLVGACRLIEFEVVAALHSEIHSGFEPLRARSRATIGALGTNAVHTSITRVELDLSLCSRSRSSGGRA
jgi:hypothetical protein